MTNKIQEAVQEYVDRKNRITHPTGQFDNAGRWYPSEEERCDCCNKVRNPSRTYPWSLMLHCRTADHVANLYGIKQSELLKAAKKLG